ncbi:hypothetical protein BJ878DRAFT_487235 [Calycina marina]|uniref:F-box domain-containing protein n=1 Tax=Calycina marina TaxID=1763456 RepID=A0A9P7ZAT7_9HELO|nr:hypothetical protein BJ878DRAFT_487235 [Calycina marina]
MEAIPVELKLRILDFLPSIGDIANLRCVSQSFKNISLRALFKHGITVHSFEVEELAELAESSEIADAIAKILIHIPDVPTLWDVSGTPPPDLDPAVIGLILERFPRLTSLSASTLTCPFGRLKSSEPRLLWDRLWREAGNGYDSPQDGFSAIRNYVAVLIASHISGSSVLITTLTLDLLPLDLLKNYSSFTDPHFPKVQNLRIGFTNSLIDPIADGIDDAMIPISIITDGILSFFRSMKNLTALDLSWGLERPQSDWDRVTVCEFILQGSFYSSLWLKLEVLRISRMRTEPKPLLEFLSLHRSIKWLSLHFSLQPEDGNNFEETLTMFRDQVRLERFELIAHDRQQRIYDVDWKPVGDVETADATAVEKFVLKKTTKWPMTTSHLPTSGWRRMRS